MAGGRISDRNSFVRVHGHSSRGLNQRAASSGSDSRTNCHARKDSRFAHPLPFPQFALQIAHFGFTFGSGAKAIALVGTFLNDQLNVILRRNLLADFL